ncbi:hypothetical protein G7Z17_g7986 [Cylindrodendrum hubeiense]|uniref:Uncharacterized protein n=1 Tax=Cylindrodendrum hubeiense TaxID=595255 RepID=A0A9P5H7A7_9HYPO|nr:hypothetical protein G7Z17_g7986 [Cylindrodendrum hubeiense]
MGPSRRLSLRSVTSRYSSEKADAFKTSTPLKAEGILHSASTPKITSNSKNTGAIKVKSAPKATSTPKLSTTPTPSPASESSIASEPSSAANSSTPSKTTVKPDLVTYSNVINDAVASLSREFQIPINLSHHELDQKTVNDVMEIYLREGVHNWDNHTKMGFAKVLSLIKITSSSKTITSNHAIWRAVIHRKEGWNWAYWIAFRNIYGKSLLENRPRITKVIQTAFPNTDIWSATTPAGMTRGKLESMTPEQSIPTPSNASPTIAATNERKRPHHALVTNGDAFGQRMTLRTKRRRRYIVAQSAPEGLSPSLSTSEIWSTPEVLSTPKVLSTPEVPSTSEVLSSPDSSGDADDGTKNKQQDTACRGLNSQVSEGNGNKETHQIIATSVPEPDVLTQQTRTKDNMVDTRTDETNQSSTNVAAAGSAQPHDAAKPIPRWATTIEEAKRGIMFLQLKNELSAHVANQIQESERRTRKQIADLPRPHVAVNNYIGQILAEMLDIKQRLSALEEDNQTRIRNAATFNVSSGLGGDSMLRALETLGHQVHNCTRDIYQLKTSQQYEEDPILPRVEGEPVEELDSGMEEN